MLQYASDFVEHIVAAHFLPLCVLRAVGSFQNEVIRVYA
jgi:hypothetical protein